MSDSHSFPSLLCEIVESQGSEVLLEPRLMGWVQDLTAGHFPLIPVLRNAIQAGVPQRLASLSDYATDERGVHIDNITLSFQDNFMLRPQAATYMVESLAYVMGYMAEEPVPFEELEQMQPQEPTGEPSFRNEEDGEFCGYQRDGQRTGFGILRRGDGTSYAGEWRLGMRMGFGLGAGARRERYAGQWYLNRQNGVGVEMEEDGRRRAGQWKQGRREGWGMEFLPNGNVVCQRLAKGKPTSGQAVCLMPNGDIVVGQMGENGPEGTCRRITSAGQTYEEQWHNGLRS